LAVIGQTLYRAGVKPTNDNPNVARLMNLAKDLPFTNEDRETVN
jgi:hypothetical protein